jgi:RNA polymerase sigma factor (sigma-70 family)
MSQIIGTEIGLDLENFIKSDQVIWGNLPEPRKRVPIQREAEEKLGISEDFLRRSMIAIRQKIDPNYCNKNTGPTTKEELALMATWCQFYGTGNGALVPEELKESLPNEEWMTMGEAIRKYGILANRILKAIKVVADEEMIRNLPKRVGSQGEVERNLFPPQFFEMLITKMADIGQTRKNIHKYMRQDEEFITSMRKILQSSVTDFWGTLQVWYREKEKEAIEATHNWQPPKDFEMMVNITEKYVKELWEEIMYYNEATSVYSGKRLLTAEEEMMLGWSNRAGRLTGRKELVDSAITILVTANRGLVKQIIAKILDSQDSRSSTWLTYEDVKELGNIGLIEAAIDYDWRKARFSTHATIKITDKIYKGLRANTASGIKITRGNNWSLAAQPDNLDEPIGERDSETLADITPDLEAVSPEKHLITEEYIEAVWKEIERRLTLSLIESEDKDRLLLILRLEYSDYSRKEIAKINGVTTQWISKLLEQAMGSIKGSPVLAELYNQIN